MKRLVFTVTNDLSYDQRMIRICSSLAANGHNVLLVGRRLPKSIPLVERNFRQRRLRCLFREGLFFYAEYNLRLLIFLLRIKPAILCAIDLDTIVPVYLASRLRGLPRVYDAHELFCEMKEVVTRPGVRRVWNGIERWLVPRFPRGYTVSDPIARTFRARYGVNYELIRNLPIWEDAAIPSKKERYILYQGAVNEGRCFETLIPAMKFVDARLIICGNGNFMEQAQSMTRQLGLTNISFMGMVAPEELKEITRQAWIGLTLFEKKGLSNYYSLANRFFDYMHAGVPQVCVDFPEYHSIVQQHPFALLIKDTSQQTIAAALNELLNNIDTYNVLQANCVKARALYNWQMEEKKLIAFYSGS